MAVTDCSNVKWNMVVVGISQRLSISCSKWTCCHGSYLLLMVPIYFSWFLSTSHGSYLLLMVPIYLSQVPIYFSWFLSTSHGSYLLLMVPIYLSQVHTGNSILSELTKAEMSKKVGHFGYVLTYKNAEGMYVCVCTSTLARFACLRYWESVS